MSFRWPSPLETRCFWDTGPRRMDKNTIYSHQGLQVANIRSEYDSNRPICRGKVQHVLDTTSQIYWEVLPFCWFYKFYPCVWLVSSLDLVSWLVRRSSSFATHWSSDLPCLGLSSFICSLWLSNVACWKIHHFFKSWLAQLETSILRECSRIFPWFPSQQCSITGGYIH